jgi:hypothetical protein
MWRLRRGHFDNLSPDELETAAFRKNANVIHALKLIGGEEFFADGFCGHAANHISDHFQRHSPRHVLHLCNHSLLRVPSGVARVHGFSHPD